ncbi:MAG: hypothetical protein ACHQ2E_04585, partial [Gemmatimonadales bacterium]
MTEPAGRPPVPVRLDRAALERIIQRAAELQTSERDIGDDLSPAEVLALGRDVGIPARYLQQALLEEQVRTGAVPASGLVDRLIGPGSATAQRVVRGEQEQVEDALIRWMEEHELLVLQRRQVGRITWEPLTGMQVALRRSAAVLGSSKRPFMLSRASEIAGTVTPLEPGYCHVTLAASLSQARGSTVGGVAALGTLAIVASGILAVMSPFVLVALLPLPIVAGLGWTVARQYRPVVGRVQLGL